MGKNILIYTITFIILITFYFTSLYIVSIIPSKYIEKNVIKSSETLLEKGERIKYSLGYKMESGFTFTDAIMINTSYSLDNNDPIKSFLLARRSYIPGQTQLQHADLKNVSSQKDYMDKNGNSFQTKELYDLMHTDNVKESFEYARYWHGYLIWLKPFLILFEYSTIIFISMVLLIVFLLWFVYLVYKKIGNLIAIPFIFAFLIFALPFVGMTINEAVTIYIGIISSIIIMVFYEKLKNKIGLIFFITGSLTSFFDLFTTPLIAYAIPLIVYFLIVQKEKKLSFVDILKIYFKQTILWILGYVLTWVTKWALTDLILKRGILKNAIDQTIIRTGGWDKTQNLLKATKIYLDSFIGTNMFLIMSSFMVINIAVGLITVHLRKIKLNIKESIPYIISFIIPFIWYILVFQHSSTHMFFVYRILLISCISILLVVFKLFNMDTPNSKKVGDK